MHVWVVWNAPHERGLLHNCHQGGLWGCVELALLKTCLPGKKSVNEKNKFVIFLFSCVNKKQAQTILILRQICWSSCLYFSKVKGFTGSQQLCNQGLTPPSPRGVKPNWGVSLMGNRVRQSPGGTKQGSSVPLLGYRFCSWNSSHTDVSLHRVPDAV